MPFFLFPKGFQETKPLSDPSTAEGRKERGSKSTFGGALSGRDEPHLSPRRGWGCHRPVPRAGAYGRGVAARSPLAAAPPPPHPAPHWARAPRIPRKSFRRPPAGMEGMGRAGALCPHCFSERCGHRLASAASRRVPSRPVLSRPVLSRPVPSVPSRRPHHGAPPRPAGVTLLSAHARSRRGPSAFPLPGCPQPRRSAGPPRQLCRPSGAGRGSPRGPQRGLRGRAAAVGLQSGAGRGAGRRR